MKVKVLIVDDDSRIRSSLERLISREGYQTLVAGSGEAALDIVQKEDPEIVFLDFRLPGIDGLTTLERIKKVDQDLVVFIMSAFGTIKDVVKAMKKGAFDYISKPYNNEEIKISLLKAEQALKVKKEIRHLRYKTNCLNGKREIVANSTKMHQILDLAKNVAKSADTPVLIQGETGVGKEVVAQIIHANSPRQDGPFLSLNCGAIPKELMESELFGYEKGAFTNASGSKQGLFELADNGTLVLDEIGELSGEGQVKLLRVLENKTFLKVGGISEKISNARIVASTNKDLKKEIERGTFRSDLYYRLSVIRIDVPPLRERKDDIIPMCRLFMEEFSKKFNKEIKRISPKAKEFLLCQEWKGNVRELKNLIERVFLLSTQDVINIDDISFNNQESDIDGSVIIDLSDEAASLDGINKLIIEKALKRSLGNQTKAAKMIGVTRSTLRYKMKKYNVVSS